MNDATTDKTFPPAPKGWVLQRRFGSFSGRAGPYYFREEGAAPGVAFYSEPHHANHNGVLHGGALLTLADMALWDVCRREVGRLNGVTVTLNAEFVGAGPVGAFIEASGEITRVGRRLIFARGLATAQGEPLLVFSGVLKRAAAEMA